MEIRTLKASIYTLLKESADRVYEYTRVPKSAIFPYLTFNLVTSAEALRDNNNDRNFVLEIDIFDYQETKNTAVLDSLFDDVFNALNSKEVIGSTINYKLNVNTVLPNLPTVNEHTFRRQITYTLKYMERGDI